MNTNTDENPVLTIHIAVAGDMPADGKKAASMTAKLKNIVDIVKKKVKHFASGSYGYVSEEVKIRFVSSPELISRELLDKLKELYSEAEIVGLALNRDSGDTGFSDLSVIEGISDDKNSIGSWLADQSDFAVVCCDDRTYGHFVSQCQAADIPTVILSTAQDGSSIWTEKSVYDSFNEEKLSAYLNNLFPDEKSMHAEDGAERTVFGYRLFWGGLYKRYMKKHSVSDDSPYPEDTFINEKKEFGILNDKQQAVRRLLIKKYNKHDVVAIKYSEKYRSSIYLRSVIPLITTIALAVGFYTETLFGVWQSKIPGTSLNLWSIIAGLGFFIYALLNLYVFRLAESKTIKAWHKGFIDNRYIAEALRIVTHFIPFGIPVNLNKTLSTYGNKIKKESDVFRRLRCILRCAPPSVTTYSFDMAHDCINYLREFVDEQIAYHKRTANRLVNICNGLERWGKIIFYLGFGFVLLRGCLQLFIVFKIAPLPDAATSWIRSFANMLALLIPTWAGYFTLKLSLCSFKTLYINNVSIVNGLSSVKQMIFDISNKNEIEYEDLRRLCEKTVSIMLGEISEWYGQINTQKVTRL